MLKLSKNLVLGACIIQAEYGYSDDEDKSNPPSNKGTMIVDATCAPSQIKYPKDTELLNEAREITEKVIDELHIPGNGKKPRTYRKKARKQYLQIARSKKRTANKLRKAIGQQLSYIKRNLKTIENLPLKTDSLPKKLRAKLDISVVNDFTRLEYHSFNAYNKALNFLT